MNTHSNLTLKPFLLNQRYTYSIYGFTVASEIELPELMPAQGRADVVIEYGQVPLTLEDPAIETNFYQIRGDLCLLHLEQKAGIRVLVQHGRCMTVERVAFHEPGTDAIRLFLLGWCMGGMLLQRSLITLHGNAIVTPQGAVILAGESGAGKSTLTADFYQRGYQILTDDISTIDWQASPKPMLQPGIPRLKLWQNKLDQFDLDFNSLRQIRLALNKYHYPVWDAYCQQAQPLHCVYILVPSEIDGICLSHLHGMKKIESLSQQFYRLRVQQGQQNWPWLFKAIATIAQHAQVRVIERSVDRFVYREVADLIETDLSNGS